MKPRLRPPPAGRIGWPEIVTYLTHDGVHHACPPDDGSPYSIQIHDPAGYRALNATGALYLESHYGPRPPAVDQQAAPK